MLNQKQWLTMVLLPLTFVIAIDHLSKEWAISTLTQPMDLGMVKLVLFFNEGFFLGSLKDLPKIFTIVLPATISGYIIFAFYAAQYFIPFYALTMRVGLSIFVGGVLANIIDRLTYGYVIDFIQIAIGQWRSGIFNIADSLQWVGVAIFFSSYLAKLRLFYAEDDQPRTIWVDPPFQKKFCTTLVCIGGFFAIYTGTLSYTYLWVIGGELNLVLELQPHLQNFVAIFILAVICFLGLLLVFALVQSARIASPIKRFENFMESAIKGELRSFQIGNDEEFQRLEGLAARFYSHFHDSLGLSPPALASGRKAPGFIAETAQGHKINIRDFLGNKVWLIFYRYSTCPLCALHLQTVVEKIRQAKAEGINIMAVYETKKSDFFKEEFSTTIDLLQKLDITLIADPERRIYSAYRTRQRLSAIFRPSVYIHLLKAKRLGFKQGSIVGKAGQLPAHFLIDEFGTIKESYYGASLTDHIPMQQIDRFIENQ